MSVRQRRESKALYLLPGSGEVTFIYPHPPLTQSQETSLRTNGLDVGTG